jgi:hypothetical protein
MSIYQHDMADDLLHKAAMLTRLRMKRESSTRNRAAGKDRGPKVHLEIRLVPISGEGVASEAVSGSPLPPIALKRKTNLRSALESAKMLKNEPETNPNEPEVRRRPEA